MRQGWGGVRHRYDTRGVVGAGGVALPLQPKIGEVHGKADGWAHMAQCGAAKSYSI
jgi:hypothetical protein